MTYVDALRHRRAASPPAQVVCSFPLGVRFPVAWMLVTCTAADAAGNATTWSFNGQANP